MESQLVTLKQEWEYGYALSSFLSPFLLLLHPRLHIQSVMLLKHIFDLGLMVDYGLNRNGER